MLRVTKRIKEDSVIESSKQVILLFFDPLKLKFSSSVINGEPF